MFDEMVVYIADWQLLIHNGNKNTKYTTHFVDYALDWLVFTFLNCDLFCCDIHFPVYTRLFI